MAQIVFVTGTDTGVGKTVVSVLLTRALLQIGIRVRAVKPFCSGGRDDAEALFAIQNPLEKLSLDEINPWFFQAPLTPLLAARKGKRRVELCEVTNFLRRMAEDIDILVVEGAGGLLSPLGENVPCELRTPGQRGHDHSPNSSNPQTESSEQCYTARELIARLRAIPVVVCPNRLGAINQSRLVFHALPVAAEPKAQLVLIQPLTQDGSQRGNEEILGELLGPGRIYTVPWLSKSPGVAVVPKGIQSLAKALL